MTLDIDEGWKRFAVRLDCIAAERQSHNAEMASIANAYATARAEWESLKAQALLEGWIVPPAPAPPDLSGFDQTGRGFDERVAAIKRERDAYLCTNAERLGEAAQARVRQLLGGAKELVEALEEVVALVNVEIQDTRVLRRALDLRDPNARPAPGYGLADRTAAPVSVAQLATLIQTGSSPLELAPIPGPMDGAPQTVRDEAWPTAGERLGLRSPHGQPFGDRTTSEGDGQSKRRGGSNRGRLL